ncbi:MAG: C40 family peptidase [Clostridia bacterium]|nr:C40 family peptidase [Clostridia bacterium]
MKENKLKFTGEELPPKSPPGKPKSAVRDLPKELTQAAVRNAVREYADDNAGTDAAVSLTGAAETSGRILENAVRNEQIRQQRKANTESLKEDGSNPVTKFHQRQAMKQNYAARKNGETAEKTAETAKTAAEKTAEAAEKAAKKTAEFVKEHWKGILIVLAIVLALVFLLDAFSACSMLFQGAGTVVAESTYAAEDGEITSAEAAYCAMEDDLRRLIDEYEDTHDYDEYVYVLDEIGHDPYVLTSILSAIHPGEWTLADVRDTLDLLFEKQYDLSEGLDFDTRMRMEPRTGEIPLIDPETGEVIVVPYDYEEEVPYHYITCTLTLKNNDLSHIPVYVMTEEQLAAYSTYMSVLGGREDLFPDSEYIGLYDDYPDYDIPEELLTDETFAAMIAEAEKYLGYPYVWGGSSPETSFDCSGFVSWVLNHAGWSIGRRSAQGLYDLCTLTASPRPGDLVFFRGTYDTPGISHVGIYVGNAMMLHCGDPIGYSNLNSSYWQEHFAGYGRMP